MSAGVGLALAMAPACGRAAPPPRPPPFGLADLAYWVGDGTNQAALVVDWNDGREPDCLAWGYRWNGAATAPGLLKAVADDDPRLEVRTWLVFPEEIVFAIGHDADGDGGMFIPGTPGARNETGFAGDPDDRYREGRDKGRWHSYIADRSPYAGGTWRDGPGLDRQPLANGSWHGWSYAAAKPTAPGRLARPAPPGLPAAAPPPPQVTLSVASALGQASPPPGLHAFNLRRRVACRVAPAVVPLSDGVQAVCRGWTGSGSAPAAGSETNTPEFALAAGSSIAWVWVTQVWFRASAEGSGRVWPAEGWQDAGTTLTARALAPTGTRFLSWGGDTAGLDAEANPIAFRLQTPRALTARFGPCSAHAVEVVDAVGVEGPATNALGRPSVDTEADRDLAARGFRRVPVVPAYPPWDDAADRNELATVAPGGRLALAFDHPVEDDPANPYGVDWILFGNALLPLAGKAWDNGNPFDAPVAAAGADGAVGGMSVSQDGKRWFALVAGASAATLFPTLGRALNTNQVETALGEWNRWWAQPTDPTRPHDPSVPPDGYAGMTLGDVCRCYRTGAGGAGFDIGRVADLPATSPRGWKWIRFVRIAPPAGGAPVAVDAIADAAPAPPFDLWRIEHFTWKELADPRISGPFSDAGSGRPNLLNYALGRAPRTKDHAREFEGIDFTPAGNLSRASVRYVRRKTAWDVGVRLERRAVTPDGSTEWTPDGIEQEWKVQALSNDLERVTALLPAGPREQYVRIKVVQQVR